MKVEIRKSFALSNREFKKGEIIDIPLEAFKKLEEKGLAQPFEGEKLERPCVKCNNDSWLFLKPKSNPVAIQCLNCGHVELLIRGKR